MAEYLRRSLDGLGKPEVLSDVDSRFASARIRKIATGGWRGKTSDEIRGSGYVVESLEAAIWCFDSTNSFEEAVLRAANLGDDADTTAAVCGQVAGAFYGAPRIPEHWLNRVSRRNEIVGYAEALQKAA